MASVGADNVAIHELPPKDNTHGLGYDPFKVSYSRCSWCKLRQVSKVVVLLCSLPLFSLSKWPTICHQASRLLCAGP